MSEKTKCSVCGSPVIYHTSDEGTQYYEALYPRLDATLNLLRRYHWGDGTVTTKEVIDALNALEECGDE